MILTMEDEVKLFLSEHTPFFIKRKFIAFNINSYQNICVALCDFNA